MDFDDLPQPVEETRVPPEELSVDGDNPNEQTQETFSLLCKNIKERGWVGNAIIADTDGLIADGQHRWEAAKKIGLDEVPVKFYDLSDEERRLWRQELNKISGEHDYTRDAEEYRKLLNSGKRDDLQQLVAASEPTTDLDALLDDSTPDAEAFEDDFGETPTGGRTPVQHRTFALTDNQADLVQRAINQAEFSGDFDPADSHNNDSDANALAYICRHYLETALA